MKKSANLTDDQIVTDIIGSLSRAGYNTDRSTVCTLITVMLEDLKDSKERIRVIQEYSDMTRDIETRSVSIGFKEH